MSKKIVAIGGGENGRVKSDGTVCPYETAPMDKEIIRLTGKERPNFLLLAHSQVLDNQENYFQIMKRIYGNKYGCECKDLKSDRITDKEYVKELIDWADIIYEGGGNTLDMIKLWDETGFKDVLREAWESGKVMCGVSAGAMCWFKEGVSDSLRIKFGEDQPLINIDCVGLMEGLFNPHSDAEGRYDNAKEALKGKDEVGLLVSNCAALEIVDDTYRIITADATNYGINAFVKKVYWDNENFIDEDLDLSDEFKPINELYDRNRRVL